MRKDILATGIDLTRAIERHIEEKVNSLDKFIDSNDESAYAKVEVEKTTNHHQKGEVFRAEINLHIAGADFRAESTAEDLYNAIDEVRDEMSKEVRRHKGKKEAKWKQGARAIKRLLRRE